MANTATMANTIIDSMANTIIIANAHYNGDDDHYNGNLLSACVIVYSVTVFAGLFAEQGSRKSK